MIIWILTATSLHNFEQKSKIHRFPFNDLDYLSTYVKYW